MDIHMYVCHYGDIVMRFVCCIYSTYYITQYSISLPEFGSGIEYNIILLLYIHV